MNSRRAWSLREYGGLLPAPIQSATTPSLPNIWEPAALYLATTLGERGRMFVAPEAVANQLHDLGLVKQVVFSSGLSHAIIFLDIEKIEAAFPPLRWNQFAISSAELDEFCARVFGHIESIWKTPAPQGQPT